VFADLPLLRHDFPLLADADTTEIENWLLREAAIISAGQLRHKEVNTLISINEKKIGALRPPRYGRSLIVATEQRDTTGAGLLDVKGCGIAEGVIPSTALHRSGLMQLGEAIQDSLVQWTIEAVFASVESQFSALPLYGVIDPGFDVVTPDGRMVPAGIQVRRAHRRAPGGIELPLMISTESYRKAEVEMLLRRFGVSSANHGTRFEIGIRNDAVFIKYGGQEVSTSELDGQYLCAFLEIPDDWEGNYFFDGINVQFTAADSVEDVPGIVDFGQFTFHERFNFGIVNLVRDRPFLMGGAMRRSDPRAIRVSEDLRIPVEYWPGKKSWDLAGMLRERTLGSEDIVKEMTIFLERLENKWQNGGNDDNAKGY
jgi:hypothetical protein